MECDRRRKHLRVRWGSARLLSKFFTSPKGKLQIKCAFHLAWDSNPTSGSVPRAPTAGLQYNGIDEIPTLIDGFVS